MAGSRLLRRSRSGRSRGGQTGEGVNVAVLCTSAVTECEKVDEGHEVSPERLNARGKVTMTVRQFADNSAEWGMVGDDKDGLRAVEVVTKLVERPGQAGKFQLDGDKFGLGSGSGGGNECDRPFFKTVIKGGGRVVEVDRGTRTIVPFSDHIGTVFAGQVCGVFPGGLWKERKRSAGERGK